MKKAGILQTAIIGAMITLTFGCSSGRYYSSPPRRPVTGTYVSLIIAPGPGILVSRYYDGRFYYRSPQGYIYWKGYDNRYYLDRKYLGKAHYDRRHYNDWKYHGRKKYRRHR